MKLIEFYPNGTSNHDRILMTYADTNKAIESDKEYIKTASMMHLSFNLIDKGYNILMVGRTGNKYRFYPGMQAPNGKKVERGHNIAKLCLAGVFDSWMV